MKSASSHYYASRMPKMMKNFEKMFRFTKKAIYNKFDNTQSNLIHENAREEYRRLIPQLPYIGGEEVSGTMNLIGGAQLLAIIRSLEAYGMNERQIGEIIYKTLDGFYNSIPKPIGILMGKIMLSKHSIKKRIKAMAETQKRKYSEGFVNIPIPGTDGNFYFGQDVLECAICKFYKKQGAEKYVPYICLGDYPMFQRMGVMFYRTKTLGNGDDVCDFRVVKKGQTMTAWPPERLKEWKNF